ncbi:uracil-DNA glycosylase family protein [Arachidicoccus sp.]|uniref:uracil-DNA glycosylase family protein n=1 Tax=Arachidicoccus sp. TaxID=1872624 RepID=UPI003D260821
MEIETHPHQPFIPSSIQILIVGSFPGKDQAQEGKWFYSAPRNQFWKIIEGVYEKHLTTTKEKQELFSSMGIGMADIILKAKRKNNTNLDQNLEIIEFNDIALSKILQQYPQIKVFFTSHFVEKHFKKLFPSFKNIACLPSPSPRFATMSLINKIARYKELLPMR